MVNAGSDNRGAAVAAGGENEEENLSLKAELAHLKLVAEQERNEKGELQKEKAKLVAKGEKEKKEKAKLKLNLEKEKREKGELKKEKGKIMLNLNELKKEKGELMLKCEENKTSEAMMNVKSEELQRQLDEAKEPIVLDLVQAYGDAYDVDEPSKATTPLLNIYDRIVSSSINDVKLRREVDYVAYNKYGMTVLQIASLHRFPHAALSRLVQCGCDIDATDKEGNTAIIIAAKNDAPAVFDSLALLGADLSVKDAKRKNILQMSEPSLAFTFLSDLHGLSKGQAIAAGFVSPLKGMATSMPQLHNVSIIKMTKQVQQCIRIMSLEMNQLRVEARERNENGYFPLASAAGGKYPLRVLKRLQVAYPAGVNARTVNGGTPLIHAVWNRNVEYVDLLLEMGSSAALRNLHGSNAFDYTTEGIASAGKEDEEKRQAIIAIFEKHGVTSNVILANSISPLYHSSIYFTQRVADANWAQYGMILMCMDEIDMKYRRKGEKALSHLSKDAKCFFKVFACVDGTDGLGNGIARILLTYIGGENMREKLTGVPLDPKF
jgi:ankyrin repeat protein